jgi:hypothetical protein
MSGRHLSALRLKEATSALRLKEATNCTGVLAERSRVGTRRARSHPGDGLFHTGTQRYRLGKIKAPTDYAAIS